jgi:bacillithiol synthase
MGDPMYIDYSSIPSHHNLFLDYIEEFENVKRFYDKNFRDVELFEPFFKRISEKDRSHNNMLSDILKSQYSNNTISKHTQHNLENLKSNKTIVVATGQQLGIMGGPLYTFYKIITAIKLCNYLKENHSDYNFVPVFWLEGDDHDYEEVRSFNVLNNENQLIKLEYEDGLPAETNRGSVGKQKFNQNIETVLNKLTECLRETEFKPIILDFIKSIYKPDRTFLESFRDLMIRLFDEFGLIIFNPLDPSVKRMLVPVFSKQITEFADHAGTLVERSAELEEIYHAQVKVKPINLFLTDNNERLLIEPTESGEFRLKGKRKKFSKEEMLLLLESSPDKFSPNVLLRPICQDFLFPTGFYVGGPAEISYFAQISPLYKIYGIEEPFLYPRSSATIVEKGVKTILEKNLLSYIDIFLDENELVNKIVSESSDINLDNIFAKTSEELNLLFEPINEMLILIDKTLSDLTAKSKIRIEETLNYLKTKATDAETRKYDSTIRQLTKVRNVLYPNGNLQERELNFIYFMNKYGMGFTEWIFNELSINKFEHQIIEL